VAAAESVAKATGLPPEVVYLYNGANGIATFDPTLKPRLVDALKKDVPVLKSAKLVGDVDVDAFVDDQYVKRAYGDGYAKALTATSAAARSEVWLTGKTVTQPFNSPAELLRYVSAHRDAVRAAYVPDASTGTLWFAEKAVWVADGTTLRPFVAPSTAAAFVAGHPGARTVPYADALKQASAS
jgi:NitT/TauT family transport system substrate-binding protein